MPSNNDNQQTSKQLPRLPGVDDLAILPPRRPAGGSTAAGVPPSITPEADPNDGEDTLAQIANPTDPHLGQTFGGYVLETKIGQGGMGTVYRGRQVSLDRVVAVKILNRQLGENAEFIKRFEREAKSIARVTHPNIVAVYDFGKFEGLWFMVNEFIEGSSLARLINERMVVPLATMIPLMEQCLSGLALVGRLDIVHRDIKPDNILITRENIPKIADFGLAKSTNDRNDSTDLTAVGLAMGTPSYMSPEQCMGRKIDHRSDQYALGVTAYFALTGSKPFTGQSSFEIMTKQRELIPPPPHQLNPSLPADCSAIVIRMLAKDPADRYPDAEACRQAWLELGLQIDPTLIPMRSGEYLQPGSPSGASGKSGRVRTPVESLPVVQPLVVAPAPQPPPIPEPPPAGRSGEFRGPVPPIPPGTSTSSRRPSVDADTAESGKPGTERQRHSAVAEAVTCPRCGQLNRAVASTCQRCGTTLRATDSADAAREQEAAQRLLDAGRHREAAAIFARLADQENDRRQKSVLRAREREARRADQDRLLSELQNRADILLARGELSGAVAVLEQARALIDPTASSTNPDPLAGRIVELHRRLAQRRRRWLLLIAGLLVIGMAGAAAWVLLERPTTPRDEAAP